MPDVTYKIEAEVTECQPPRCMVVGKITTMDGQIVAEAIAKMAMMDRMPGASVITAKMPEVSLEQADTRSLTRVYTRGGGGGDGGGGGGTPAGVEATLAELKRLQRLLVTQLQNEYFCDDVEPPSDAFGWAESKLRDYFENGGA